ncbi:hypothetical protein J9097_004401 [Vibrio vulnificus]|nr:hypothetical protein [Vibrio vulnificus]
MDNYQLFKNASRIEAVNMNQFTARDDVQDLLADGFMSLGFVMASSQEDAISKENTASPTGNPKSEQTPNIAYESNYKTAQLVSKIISGFGWFIFSLGIIGLLMSLGAGNTRYGFIMSQFIAAAAPGFVALISGLFLVAAGQVMKATVDNADHTYQIFSHLKNN